MVVPLAIGFDPEGDIRLRGWPIVSRSRGIQRTRKVNAGVGYGQYSENSEGRRAYLDFRQTARKYGSGSTSRFGYDRRRWLSGIRISRDNSKTAFLQGKMNQGNLIPDFYGSIHGTRILKFVSDFQHRLDCY